VSTALGRLDEIGEGGLGEVEPDELGHPGQMHQAGPADGGVSKAKLFSGAEARSLRF
jgi:hypothetical protein